MTLTGHWNRIDQKTSELWPQNVLEQEKQRWQERWDHFCAKIIAHMSNGGSINPARFLAFKFIAKQSIIEIQDKVDMLDILEGKIS